MLLTALTTAGAVLLAWILSGIAFFLVYRRAKSRVIMLARSFFEAPDTKTPSDFGRLIDSTAILLAQRFSQSIKATFMGIQSVDSKNETRIEEAIVKDGLTQQMPLAGMVLDSFPSLSKMIRKNPGRAVRL